MLVRKNFDTTMEWRGLIKLSEIVFKNPLAGLSTPLFNSFGN